MKYKYRFDSIYSTIRWMLPKSSRNSNWTIIGISTRWASPNDVSYSIGFFGWSITLWLKREPKDRNV